MCCMLCMNQRITGHLQSGSIKEHFRLHHSNTPLTREHITNNISILSKASNRYQLAIKEALLIHRNQPSINKQFNNFSNILKLHPCRPTNSNSTLRLHGNDTTISSDTVPTSPPPSVSPIIHNIQHNSQITNHQVSPNINIRINQLFSPTNNQINTQYTLTSPRPLIPLNETTPIAYRLRSSVHR